MRESGRKLIEATSEQRSKTGSLPIIVDLDGTLVLSDTREESVVLALFRIPVALMKSAPALVKGRLAFKEALARVTDLTEHSLPLREDLLDWLREQIEKGHEMSVVR
jgi:hypothetical protein